MQARHLDLRAAVVVVDVLDDFLAGDVVDVVAAGSAPPSTVVGDDVDIALGDVAAHSVVAAARDAVVAAVVATPFLFVAGQLVAACWFSIEGTPLEEYSC